MERLLEARGLLTRSDIESFVAGDEIAAERAAWRERFLGEVLRIVEIELEAEQRRDHAPYAEAIAAAEGDRSPGS